MKVLICSRWQENADHRIGIVLVLAVAVKDSSILDRGEYRTGFAGLVISSKEDHQGENQDDQDLNCDTRFVEGAKGFFHLISWVDNNNVFSCMAV